MKISGSYTFVPEPPGAELRNVEMGAGTPVRRVPWPPPPTLHTLPDGSQIQITVYGPDPASLTADERERMTLRRYLFELTADGS